MGSRKPCLHGNVLDVNPRPAALLQLPTATAKCAYSSVHQVSPRHYCVACMQSSDCTFAHLPVPFHSSPEPSAFITDPPPCCRTVLGLKQCTVLLQLIRGCCGSLCHTSQRPGVPVPAAGPPLAFGHCLNQVNIDTHILTDQHQHPMISGSCYAKEIASGRLAY